MHDAPWTTELARRAKSDWLIKIPGITGFMTLFFITYFFVLNYPAYPVVIMPLTPVDHWIALRPSALWLYISLWFYSSLAAGLCTNRRVLARHALVAGALAGVGSLIFYFWPTAVPATNVDWSAHRFLGPLKSADATGNACPSLHVAFAVLAAVSLGRTLREIGSPRPMQILNAAWCAGIIYSTVALRQHVVIDVIAGAALGAAASFFLPKRERRLDSFGFNQPEDSALQRSRKASCASRSGT